MRSSIIHQVAISLIVILLAACSSIPNSGPSGDDISQKAGTSAGLNYVLVDITPKVDDILSLQNPSSFQSSFGDYRPSVEPRIGIGDSVSVTIWEASTGGLFSAPLVTDKFSTGSKSATIPDQVVGRDGSISVPYAGRIHVAGQTTRVVQKIIERALQGKAIQPQVLVNVTRSISSAVTVTGEVLKAGRIPLSVRGDRIMDIIAEAGGIRTQVNELYVQLLRGSKTVRVPLSRVASDPRENIFMRPNDVLTIIRDPQTFIAYGATGKNAEIPFDAEGINLSQALAKSGGLLDSRSDAAGVFVFRYEPQRIVRTLRPELRFKDPYVRIPVVYKLNLHNPDSLFAAQAFQIRSRDVLYVSNAPMIDVEKVLGVISTVTSPGLSAASVCVDARC